MRIHAQIDFMAQRHCSALPLHCQSVHTGTVGHAAMSSPHHSIESSMALFELSRHAHEQARQAGTVAPMALASRDDVSQLAWTSGAKPSAAMRRRIVALAERALSALQV